MDILPEKERHKMKYKKGYKYQLAFPEAFDTPFGQADVVRSSFITLYPTGVLVGHPGYAWDGCSGPTVDTKKVMRG